MAELSELQARIHCDTSEVVTALDVLKRHGDANPVVTELFNQRFPAVDDICELEPQSRQAGDGLFDARFRLRATDALKSFIQDLA